MLYAAQLEDGNEIISTIINAINDKEALERVEQWMDENEWEAESIWQNLKIWRVGELISNRPLRESLKKKK